MDPWGAWDLFGAILVEDPGSVDAFVGRADALVASGELEDALRDLRCAQRLLTERRLPTADVDRRIAELAKRS